jgi:hypothetical protein
MTPITGAFSVGGNRVREFLPWQSRLLRPVQRRLLNRANQQLPAAARIAT